MFLLSILFASLLFHANCVTNGPQHLSVALFYESLCPDCIDFIKNQFRPTYNDLQQAIAVDFIPFGNAQASNDSGKWTFHCQHGPKECYGNKVHSCALSQNPIEKALNFISCSMSSRDPSADKFSKLCATFADISWSRIQNCITSGKGDELLAENGAITKKARPRITFVPTIFFNDKFNATLQDRATREFKKVVCELLAFEPAACHRNAPTTLLV